MTLVQRITLIVGILTGLYTMQLSISTDINLSDQVEVPSEDESSDEVVIKSIDAINYSSQINVDHEVFLIEEISESEESIESSHIKDQVVTKSLKVFRILFQRIISPNAP